MIKLGSKGNVSPIRMSHALPETNIALENRSSQKETSLPIIHFQGANLLLVSGRINMFSFEHVHWCILHIRLRLASSSALVTDGDPDSLIL